MADPKGFKCECGVQHRFAMWVYAHWDEELIHTCPDCKRQHKILRGRVTPVRQRRKAAAKEKKP